MTADRADRVDRGQLVLIAAIAIAFVILGVVVVFNSVLYTQTISSGGSIEASEDVRATHLEVDRGLSGLVRTMNRNGDGGDEDAVNSSVAAFAHTYRNATADSRPSLVNVSAHVADEGTLIQNRSTEPVSVGTFLFNDSDGAEHDLESLELTLDTDQLTDDIVIADPDGGDEIRFGRDGDNLTVDVDGTSPCPLTRTGDTVTVEVIRGETNALDTERCLPDEVGDLDGSYAGLEITGSDPDVDMSFELVLESARSAYAHDGSDPHAGEPPLDVVIGLETTLTYDSSDVSYEHTDEIRVYGERP